MNRRDSRKTDTSSPIPASEKRILLLIFFTVFIDLIGFGIIIPIQPFFAEHLGASPTVVTLLGASFSLMQFLFAPVWGRLSDRYGRRPILLMSIATGAVGYLIFGLAHSLSVLFFSRMLAGFGAANIGTAQAIIADVTPEERRARGMGLIGAAFGLGFIVGPALGGGFGQLGISAPAFVASFLCLLNWGFAFWALPETNPDGARASGRSLRPGLSWGALRHAARHPNVPQLFVLYLVFTTAFSLMEQVLGLFIERTWLGGTSVHAIPGHSKHAALLTTYVLIVIGMTSTVVQGGLIGRLVKKFGEARLLIIGNTLVACSFVGIPLAGALGPYLLLLGVAIVLAAGVGMVNPCLSSLLSRSVSHDEQGGVLGIGQSLSALGRVLGPSVAGVLFEVGAPVPFWTGAVILVGCALVAVTLRGSASPAFAE